MSSVRHALHKIWSATEAALMAPVIFVGALGVVLLLGAAYRSTNPTYGTED